MQFDLNEMNLKIDKCFEIFEKFPSIGDTLHEGKLGKIVLSLSRKYLKDGKIKIWSSSPHSGIPSYELNSCHLTFEALKKDLKSLLKDFLDNFENEANTMKEFGFENLNFSSYENSSLFVCHQKIILGGGTLIYDESSCHKARTKDLVIALNSYGKSDLNHFRQLPPELRDYLNKNEVEVVEIEEWPELAREDEQNI